MSNIIDIPGLSDEQVTTQAELGKLIIDFKKEEILVEYTKVIDATHPLIDTIRQLGLLKASNTTKLKVNNADGSPSLIQLLDEQGNPITQVVSGGEEILEDNVDENGNPVLDAEGNPMVDSEGNPTKKLVGYTPEVKEPVMERETIGEFDFWKIIIPQLIPTLQSALIRNLDPNEGGELEYTKGG